MRRAGLAFLLTGAAMAGGGGAPAGDDVLRPLLALSGKSFDLAWLDAVRMQAGVLAGLSELEIRYGQNSVMKDCATRDKRERSAQDGRLQNLKNQLKLPNEVSGTDVVVAIASGSEKDFFSRVDTFYLSEYRNYSAQISTLARLGLSRSRNEGVRREAATVLTYETKRINELRKCQ